MLKYTDAKVVMAEVPNEITLAINISGCPCHCNGCHSAYLAEDIGIPLNEKTLQVLIDKNKGVSCIAFMGGDNSPYDILKLAKWVKENTVLAVAWYSGRQEIAKEITQNLKWFNYIKIGPYIEEFGPLDCKTTNQKFYEVIPLKEYYSNGSRLFGLDDITYKFWKN
nr:MAG TPA: anaerobic ribonucleoside-triphosphate reductase activating protein [Caudoviricetes sp.]